MKTHSTKHISTLFDANRFQQPTGKVRNQREDLIEQIADQCTFRTPGDRTKLTRLLAIAANAGKWTAQDLHALLKKKHDPTLRNYTAFVWWSAKIKNKV